MRTGFFRTGDAPLSLPRLPAGPELSYGDADEMAHRFIVALAQGRALAPHADPIEHAHANGLMILYSAEAADAFETILVRMPEPRVRAWRELIAGGASSEAFGPLTLQEKLDETQVDDALAAGRKQRIVNLAVALLGVVAVAGGGFFAYNEFITEEQRTEGAIQLADTGEAPEVAAAEGGPPVVEAAVTTGLVDTVAVAIGDGPVEDRSVTAAFSAVPYPPGSMRASLFQYAGSGHVVVVGPPGFSDAVCLRASVVTSDLRPLDTVTTGPCADPVGRTAVIGCRGQSAILLSLKVPDGEVELPEGGTGFADAVRVQLIADGGERYETLTVRGTIRVDPANGVVIPRFGGDIGTDVTFDLGASHVGTCTLTGDFPT
ncbi:MAG: hypothetical protein GWP48_12950 [Actinobacteria bacterium]|nr:hypothetical protein [Actinomycetota bacterium]